MSPRCQFAALLALVAGGCATDDDGGSDVPGDLEGRFDLYTVRTIAAELPVAGIDTDGAGGLWIVYSLETGDYFAKDDVRVVHLDANGTKLKEIRFADEYSDVKGLAFTGDAVWLSHTGDNNYLRKLDPETGAVLGTFGTENGIVDLDSHGAELRMSVPWDQVIGIDPVTGGERWRAGDYLDSGGSQRGIASMEDGRVWVSTLGDQIYVLDPKGHIVGRGTHHLLDYDTWTVDVGLYLAWDGHNVIVAADGQIAWLEPRN